MKLLDNKIKLNNLLTEIIFSYDLTIPSLYKVSEVYLEHNSHSKKFAKEFLFIRRYLSFCKIVLVTGFKSLFKKRDFNGTKSDILLVSHHVEKALELNFFFGDLKKDFNKLNRTVVDLRIDSESPQGIYFDNQNESYIDTYCLPSLSLSQCRWAVRDLIKTFILILSAQKKEKDPEKKELLKLIRNRLFSKTNFFNFCFSIQLDKFFKTGNFKLAIVTFDGNPWERILCRKFKKNSPTGMVAFYQHAPISEKSFSLFNEYPSFLNPDRIYCSGEIPQNIFFKNISYTDQILVIGSRKFLTNGLNKKGSKSNTVLFVTQGSRKEIGILYRLALKVARLNKSIEVKVLVHPATSLGFFLSTYNPFLNLFLRNFRCLFTSEEKIFIKSKYMIYFSSSLPIEKMVYGFRPIHLKNPRINNPLDSLVNNENPILSWCTEIEGYEDLLEIINDTEGIKFMKDIHNKEYAINFSRKYFEPFKISEEIIRD